MNSPSRYLASPGRTAASENRPLATLSVELGCPTFFVGAKMTTPWF